MRIVRLPSFKHAIWLGPVWAGAGALLLFCLGVLFPEAWLSVGVYHITPYFCDLHAVLGASDAVAAGADPFAVPNPFDVMGRPHVYGPVWLSLHHLGLSRQDVPWLGVLLLVSVLTLGAAWLAPRSWGDTLLATAWLASPPFLLAYERGNNDLVIVLLLGLTGLMTSTRWRGLGNGLAGIALLVATLMKFYPAAGAGALLATGSRRASICRLLFGVGVTTILVSWQWPLFAAAFRVTPTWGTVYGFGLPVIVQFFRLLPDAAPWFLCGALLALTALGGVLSRTRFHRWIAVLLRDPGASAWMVAAGGAWVACFMALGNFPYRAVLLLAVIAAWLRAGRASEVIRRSVRSWAWLGAVTVWLLSPYCYLLLSPSPAGRHLGYVVAGIMHTLSIGLTLFIGGLILGWLHARYRYADE